MQNQEMYSLDMVIFRETLRRRFSVSRLICVALILALTSHGCSSWRSIEAREGSKTGLESEPELKSEDLGRTVIMRLIDRSVKTGKLVAFDESSLTCKGNSKTEIVPYSEIERLDVCGSLSWGRTAVLISGVLVFSGFALLWVIFSGMESMS